MRAEVRPSDGVNYYTYVPLVLVVHHDATDVLLRLDKYFKMKPGLIGNPDVYLDPLSRCASLMASWHGLVVH